MADENDPGIMLTRRDGLRAGAVGLVGGGAVAAVKTALEKNPLAGGDSGPGSGESDTASELTGSELSVLQATAEVVYPTEVEADESFFRGYVSRLGPERTEQIKRTVGALQAQAKSAYGRAFEQLSPERREALLRDLGVDRAHPNPEGTVATRVRYHIVNGLLYALFTNPKGSRLLGIENPLGYPGGYYRGKDNE
jgi:hypothetical protein